MVMIGTNAGNFMLPFFSFLGGFANYVVGMTSLVAKSLGVENPDPRDVVDNFPTGRWMLFLFVISMVGIMTSVPLNKVIHLSYFYC
jgi:hypothetical protein